jgi:hypothetical protein
VKSRPLSVRLPTDLIEQASPGGDILFFTPG